MNFTANLQWEQVCENCNHIQHSDLKRRNGQYIQPYVPHRPTKICLDCKRPYLNKGEAVDVSDGGWER